MDKKKLRTLVITCGVILIGLFVILTSYAYWQITRKQIDKNDMVTACLDFDMVGGPGIDLGDSWPISDEDGRKLTGYEFTVTNKCDTDVNYIIALESLESDSGLQYFNNNYIKVAVDDEVARRYGALTTIDNVVLSGDTEVIRETREVTSATVKGKAQNEHTIRIWLSEDAPLDEQNKVFKSRVRITGGQGVENPIPESTADGCFNIDETTGEITKYLIETEGCGTNVVIPATIDGTPVKSIDTNAFRTTYNEELYLRGDDMSEDPTIDFSTANLAYVINDYELGDEIDWANMTSLVEYAIVLTNDTGIRATLDYMASNFGVDLVDAVNNPEAIPELLPKQLAIYQKVDANLSGNNVGYKYMSSEDLVSIDGLDLSKAHYLETIEERAFSNVAADVATLDDYDDYPESLTSLTFGNNTSAINIGDKAFSRINVPSLTLYTSYVGNSGFVKATIADLDVKAFTDASTLESQMLNGVVAENLDINEGVTYIGAGNNVRSEFMNTDIGTLTLPATLTNTDLNKNLIGQYNSSNYASSVVDRLIINTPITTISNMGSETLQYVKLPETLKTIENGTFAYSTINDIYLPSGLEKIGEYAFQNTELNEVTIPASVNTISKWAFYGSKLTKIEFENTVENPSNLTIINEKVFYDCDSLESVTIPNTVSTIDEYAFADSVKLKEVIFENTDQKPSQLGIIEMYAFQNIPIENVVIPSSVGLINSFAFYGHSLNSITFEDTEERPSQLHSIYDKAFGKANGNSFTISQLIIPGSIRKMQGRTFWGLSEYSNILINGSKSTSRDLDIEWYWNAKVTYASE